MSEVFNLPDVGEGLTEAEIVSWKVKPGDSVRVNDVIVEIETAKSLVELPCPYAGVVERLLVDEGATVEVGTPIIAVGTGEPQEADGGTAARTSGEDLVPTPEPRPDEDRGEQPADDRQAVLVGYGPRSTSAKRRPRKTSPADEGAPTRVDHGRKPPKVGGTPDIAHDQRQGGQAGRAGGGNGSGAGGARVFAKPPVRKLAKDLGVDLAAVAPSGPGGTVTRDDVHAAAPLPADHAVAARHAGDGWGGLPREERIPIRSVRKTTAANVVKSAFTAPHVTEFVTVDVTRTTRLLNRLRESRELRDVRLSPMALVARAMCLAVRRTPEVNAHWDEDAGEIVMRRYVNLGIAAATPRGLVVPNIKDADRLSLRDLALAINELAETAREGRTPPEDMTGGTISITNVGVFGIDTGTPILPPGEAAIIAFGAVKQQPWVHKGTVKPRWVTTLGLSFDHRLVDGEQGSRFLADVAALLEDPANALVWG